MPKIQIRPAVETDIPILVTLEHDYVSDDVWQMEIRQDEDDGEGEQERGEEVAAPSLGHGVVAAMVPRSPGGGAATRG